MFLYLVKRSGDIKSYSFFDLNNSLIKDIKSLITFAIVIAILAAISLAFVDANAQSADPSRANNTIIMHFHPRLNITVEGKALTVPAQIGINSSLWKGHSLDKYGMQSMNMIMPGMAPLHTHDSSGIIHVESSINRNYTLGEFLKIWGLDLNGKTVKMTVDGQPVSDLRNHILRDKEHIILDIKNKIT